MSTVLTPDISARSAESSERVARRAGWRWLVPVALLAIYAAQCGRFIWTQSLTFDEPFHISAGLDAWRLHRFANWNDHPPLARMLCTLPVFGHEWQVQISPGLPLSAVQPDVESLAHRSRSVNMALGIVLGILLWFAARRYFSEGAANFALAPFAFSPELIANYSMVTTDGAGALMIFAAALAVVRWRSDLSERKTISLGLIFGALLLSKFYAPPLALLGLALLLVPEEPGAAFRPREWRWRRVGIVSALALIVVWGGYFFRIAEVDTRTSTLFLPFGDFFNGLRNVWWHNAGGHNSYFLGEISMHAGGWLYFPVTAVLKWPPVTLLLAASALFLLARGRLKVSREVRWLLIFPAVFAVLSLFSNIHIGVRHLLPIYPFLLLLAGALWEAARGRRGLIVLLVAAAAVNAGDALRYAPNYLSYFTPFVPEASAYKYLSDSNLDCGQGLLAVRQYQQEHPQETIHLAYVGNVVPAIYGVHAPPLAENARTTGTVIISSSNLAGEYLRNPEAYHWLLRFPRKTILDHVLFVFEVPPGAEAATTSKH